MSDPTVSTAPKRRTLFWLAGAGLVLLALAAGTYLLSHTKRAPDVGFTSLSGEKLSTRSLRGQVVVVNFWATSCVTCVKEMPEMVATYNKYRADGLRFVAVAMAYDPPNYVVNFTQTRQLPFTVALDVDGGLARAFDQVTLTPTTFVIGKDGSILKRYVGAPDFAQFHALLEKALHS